MLPSTEQIAEDKAKLAEFKNITGDKHLQRGGKAGFGILGFLALFLILAIPFAAARGIPKMPTNGAEDFLGFRIFAICCVFTAAFSSLVCSFIYGFKFMDKTYDEDKALKQKNFKQENNIEEIESRMAAYPELYA